MSDIELVIKIPDNYMDCIDKYERGSLFDMVLTNAIKNGIPLPKGHGRIGDIDQMEYLKALHDAKFGKIKFSEAINKIKNSIPTIVGADNAG